MSNKRGLSVVVSTLSIILLSITAVFIVAKFVVPLVKTNLSEGTECIAYKNYFEFEEDFGYNCYTAYDGDAYYRLYGLTIRSESVNEEIGEGVDGFMLAFLEIGDSTSVRVINGTQGSDGENEIRMMDIDSDLIIPNRGEVKTYVYRSIKSFKSVEIYPLLKSGRMCDRSDSIKLTGEICDASLPPL